MVIKSTIHYQCTCANGEESQQTKSQENARKGEDESSGNASTTTTLTLVDPSHPSTNSSTPTNHTSDSNHSTGPKATASFLEESDHAAPTNPQ